MARQDEIIEIRLLESIDTSIVEYFLNIALVTPITENDLLEGQSFDASGKETYKSLQAVAEKFATTSRIYEIARDVFNQKTNVGINQSTMRNFIVVEKKSTHTSYKECLESVGNTGAYYLLVNPQSDADISSVMEWANSKRKLVFAETNTNAVKTSATDDIASALKNKKYDRVALYYHETSDESLAGALASILASSPVARKNASFKTPTGITVDELKDTEEENLKDKNVNYYVHYIGYADDYGTRDLTSDNGVVSSGKEIQFITAVDRVVLSLQAGLMDAIQEDIPYDGRGETIVHSKVEKIFSQLKLEGIFAEDSVDEETGILDKSYDIKVLTRATVKNNYPDQFKAKAFVVQATVNFAGSGKKVVFTLAY